MTLASSLQRTRDRGVSTTLAATEMVSQHIAAFEGLGAEFTAVRAISGVLLLVPQQMGLALELLATLIAGRQALSLHLDGTIVVERQAGCCDRGRFIWGASGGPV